LSPFLFLLAAEGLSRLVHLNRLEGPIKGIMVVDYLNLDHLLFASDVLLFGEGMLKEWRIFKHIINSFCLAMGLEININKSLMLGNELSGIWRNNYTDCLNLCTSP